MEMNYKEIYEKAYKYMGEDVIDGNCGDLCECHCCRNHHETGETMGIYFLPFEYEVMQKENDNIEHENTEYHTSEEFLFTEEIEYLVYSYCNGLKGCNRELRPVQCRSYPFAPHLEKGVLYLVIEKEQEHDCPLMKIQDQWRPEFINGIYKGWQELLKIKEVEIIIRDDSEVRDITENIVYKWKPE